MQFDDYNYNQYNSYVLIEEPAKQEERDKITKERKLIAKGKSKKTVDDGSSNQQLSEKNFENYPEKQYFHDAIRIEPLSGEEGETVG